MKATIPAALAVVAATPAMAHGEHAFFSGWAHELAHLHAFGGPIGLGLMIAAALMLAVPRVRERLVERLRSFFGGDR